MKSILQTTIIISISFICFTISAKTLWTRIKQEDKYTKYKSWPGYDGMHPGKAPHGRYHKIYVNDIALNSLPNTKRVLPEGSIIVKENFSGDKEMVAITMMAKVNGYNPSAGDWFWAKYDIKNKSFKSGKPAKCIECHTAEKNNDYGMLYRIYKPLK
jgi:hypothetical protein